MKTGRRLGPVLTIALALSLLPLAWHVLSYATARLLEIDRVRAESEQHEWVMSLRGFFETHPPLLVSQRGSSGAQSMSSTHPGAQVPTEEQWLGFSTILGIR